MMQIGQPARKPRLEGFSCVCEGPRLSLADAEDALEAVQTRWNAGAADWDPDRLAAIYTEAAAFFGGRPYHSVGRTEIRGYFDSYRGTLRSITMHLVGQHVLQLGAQALVAQGHGDFDFTLEGGRLANTTLRTTLCLLRAEGTWQIVQHHFSAIPQVPPIPQ